MKIVEHKCKSFTDISEGDIKDPHAYAARSIRVGRKFLGVRRRSTLISMTRLIFT